MAREGRPGPVAWQAGTLRYAWLDASLAAVQAAATLYFQVFCMIRFRPLGRWILPLLLVAACAQAPVQEMSDARQALQAARAVAEKEIDVARLQQAERTLREAESALEAGRYADARRQAEAARAEALEVRQRATAE